MAERNDNRMSSILVRADQALIGVISEKRGHEIVRYFTEEKAADASISKNATKAALSVIGAWSDLNWEQIEAALDHIRHQSQPTPPITNLL